MNDTATGTRVTGTPSGGNGELEAQIHALIDEALEWRHKYFLRLSWASTVTEDLAQVHIDRYRKALRRDSSGVGLVTGLHRDPMLHAHGLLKLSRRLHVRFATVTELRDFLALRWPHGEMWVRAVGHTEHPAGAVHYLARHPETLAW